MEITQINVPDGERGPWKVSTFKITEEQAKLDQLRSAMHGNRRGVYPGTYKQLTRHGQVIMSNTHAECRDHKYFVHMAKGIVLINGLGLGVVLTEILAKEDVTEVTVVEKDADVISLVGPSFGGDPRVTIINEDCFTFRPPKGRVYDAVWHDIWDYICADNLTEMAKLHRKYGRRSRWQGSWCKAECQWAGRGRRY